MILYLHGFRSSPRSTKARLLHDRMAQLGRSEEFLCPQLPVSPLATAELLKRTFVDAGRDPACIIGSSLGGYYATWLAERIRCAVVLLNPAVRPQRDLASQLGIQRIYHTNETEEIKPQFVDELESLWVPSPTELQRYFLVCAKGDEVLDWREMAQRYPGAHQLILEGGDHGLSNFNEIVDQVLAFAGIVSAPQS